MSGFRFRLVKEKTTVDFAGKRRVAFCLSAMMVALTLFLLFTRGLNLGIDFTGGVLIEARLPAGMQIADARAALSGFSEGTPTIQEFGESSVMIKVPGRDVDSGRQKEINAEAQRLLGDKVEFRRVEFVGPQVGAELIAAGVKAFIYSMIGILAYVWIRFEWQFGVTAVLALAHDMCACVLFFLVTQFEFDLSTVAAVLLVAGYSINETIVVFDRIREMLRKYRKAPLEEVINLSINDTLSRTLMTSLTTIMAMTALVVFGSEAVKGFGYAMLIGIFFGPYSSMFVSAPALLYLNLRREVPAANDEKGAAAGAA